MNYLTELKKTFQNKGKPILVTTGVIWFFWPFIKAVVCAVYIIIKGLTIDNIIEFIIKALWALVPRIVDPFLNPLRELIAVIIIFFLVLNAFWLSSLVSKSN